MSDAKLDTVSTEKLDRTGPRIEVIEDATGECIHVVKLVSNNRKHAEKVERGLMINMDHERFTSKIVIFAKGKS